MIQYEGDLAYLHLWDGTKRWYLNGEKHREDGPAIEWANGTKYWFLNGKRHREDGPAIESSMGTKRWFLNGEELSHSEWKEEVTKLHKMNIGEPNEKVPTY